MGRYTADEDELRASFGPARNVAEAFVQNQWTEDPERAIGLPVGIQLIGRRHNEEKVLAMLQVLERALKEEGELRGVCA